MFCKLSDKNLYWIVKIFPRLQKLMFLDLIRDLENLKGLKDLKYLRELAMETRYIHPTH